MAICTQCGAVWSNEDMDEGKEHVCKPEDIPKKGKVFRLNGIKENL